MSLFPTTSTLICFELAKCFVNRNIHPSSIQNFKSPQTGKLKKCYKFLKGKEERREIKNCKNLILHPSSRRNISPETGRNPVEG